MSVLLSRKCICSSVFAASLRLSPAFWRGVVLLLLGAMGVPLLSETAHAKRYLIDVWQGERGLPQNTITGIAQTSDGYLWITTLDGVARFDGVRFRMFKAGDTPALGSGRIRFLLTGRQGELWLATQEGGVIQLEDDRFTPLALPESRGIRSAVIQVAREDSGALWLFVDDKGERAFAVGEFFFAQG